MNPINTSDRWTWVQYGKLESPPSVLIHGWDETGSSLTKLLPAVLPEYHVYIPDLPGFGLTPPPPQPWGVSDFSRALFNAVQNLHITKPITIIAHSFGALIAVAFAANYPQFVGALVLISPPIFRKPPSRFVQTKIRLLKLGARWIRYLPMIGERLIHQAKSHLGSSDYRHAGAMRDSLVKILGETEMSPLSSVYASTLMIYGEQDHITRPLSEKEVLNRIPHCQVKIVPNAGHYLFREKPEEVNNAIRQFLAANREHHSSKHKR